MKKFKLFVLISCSTFFGLFSVISIAQIKHSKSSKQTKEETVYGDYFINQVIEKVKKDYVEEKTDSELTEAAVNGILTSLDPHSSFLNPESLKEMNIQTKGEFGGIGIEITTELSVIKVVSAIEDTPAYKAGLKSGDYVIKIDNQSVFGLSIEDVVKKIRGKPGTTVKLVILRKGEKQQIEKSVTRQIIKVKAIKANKFKDVAYIKITTFSEQATKGLEAELKKLKLDIGKDKIRGLVLDLRNNPGGLLDQAIAISDEFLNKNQLIVSIKGRQGAVQEFRDQLDEVLIPDLPIVVLINEGSASASEIVAGALQDNKRAVVMGSKSFGKGSVQSVIPLEGNKGALRMTTSLYYTPSGKSIQAHGIEPDIELAEATIEKQKQIDRDSEADLKGHIEVQIKDAIDNLEKEKISDENVDIYAKDYQLARAIDLIRGIGVYKSALKK